MSAPDVKKKRPSEQYLGMVMDCLTDSMEPDNREVNAELNEVVLNSIFGREGPRVVSTEPSELMSFVANKLFRGISEIHSSRRCLANIPIYIRRAPYTKLGVSRVDYLQYNIEGFFHEIYIFKERLETYSKVVERAWKGSGNRKEIEQKMNEARTISSRALSRIGRTRGAHVHRFRYSDDDTDRLGTLELLAKYDDSMGAAYQWLFDSAYRETRRKWVNQMRDVQGQLDSLLDVYSQLFIDCISDGSKILLPKKIVRSST